MGFPDADVAAATAAPAAPVLMMDTAPEGEAPGEDC